MNNKKCPYYMCDKLKLEKENPRVLSSKCPNVQIHPEGNTNLQTLCEGPTLEKSDPKNEKKKLKCARSKKSEEKSAAKKSVTYGSTSSVVSSGSKPSNDSLAIRNKVKKDDCIGRSSDTGTCSSDSEIKGTRGKRRKRSQQSLRGGSKTSLSSCGSRDSIKRKRKNENKESTQRIKYCVGKDSQDNIRTHEGQGSKHKIKSHRKKRGKRRKCSSCCTKMRSRLACCCVRCCLACCCIAPKNRGKLVACSTSCQSSTIPTTKRDKRSRRKCKSKTRRGRSRSRSESSGGSKHSLVKCKSTTSERKSKKTCSESESKRGSKHSVRRSKCLKRKKKNRNSSSGSDSMRSSKHSTGRSKCSTSKRRNRKSSSGSECSCGPPRKARSRSCSVGSAPKKVTGDCLSQQVKNRPASRLEPRGGCLPQCENFDKEPAGRRRKSPRSSCFDRGKKRPLRPPTCSGCSNMSPNRDTEPAERNPPRCSRPRSPCGRYPDAPSRPRSGRSAPRRRRRPRRFRSPYADRSKERASESRPSSATNLSREPADNPDQSRHMLLSVCSSAHLEALIKSWLPAINCPGCPKKLT